MKYAKNVELTYGEKKALRKKYNKIMNKVARSKKVTVSQVPTESVDGNGSVFFKYAYRYYYLLDLPAREAFAKFCETMRTADRAKAAAYILIRGEADRDGLKKSVEEATFGYSYGLSEKFEYIKKKCFGAKKGATT